MSSTNVNNNKQTGILILGKQKTTFEIFVFTIRYNNTKRKALKTTFGVVVLVITSNQHKVWVIIHFLYTRT